MRRLFLFSLFMVLGLSHLLAQNRVIRGTVEDDKGEPLVGATILVVGGGITATTDGSGNFSVNISPTARQLAITYVGYVSQTINIRNQAEVFVQLVSNDPSLSEVVVVAYGSVKKEALTGSVGTVRAEEIRKRPINNITNALEGAIPGVVTASANGQPGSGNTIRVRGFGSVNASLDPLFVVDGVAYLGNLSNINPDDVESVTVLKDAASTALYGSRAANGVVIVTTKKGQKGRNNISLRVMQGRASRGLPEYDRVDAFQYYPVMWEAYRNSLVYPTTGAISIDSASRVASGLTSRSSIKDLLGYNPFNVAANTIVGQDGTINPSAKLLYGDDLDWTKDLMRNGTRKDYSINFNGGAEKSDYFLSAGYVKEDGYTLKTDFERYSARLNVNVQPRTWLRTGLNISGNFSTSNLGADDDGAGSTSFVNPFFFSRNIGPIYPVYAHNMTTGAYVLDANGQRIWDLGNFGSSPIGIQNGIPNRAGSGFSGRHVLAETSLNEEIFRRTVVSARNYIDINFTKDLKFTNNVGVDFQSEGTSSYENTLVGDGAPAGRSRKIAETVTGLTYNQLLNYVKSFGDNRVDVLVGHESFSRRNTELNAFKQGQSLTGNTELGNFTTNNAVTSLVDRNTIESYFSRLNYSYSNRYFLSGSIRRDGNSRFATESRWGTFWSIGGGWNLNNETFLKTANWIDLLKLRSSYGSVGNAEGIGYYAYQGLYVFNNNANESGIVQSQTAFLNRALTWEENSQFDIGLDFSLIKGRISGSIEYYKRETVDLLFAVPQPVSSGATSIQQNTATMYNKGYELNLNGNIIQSRDFIWNMTVNLSTVKSQITKMPDLAKEIINGTKKQSEGHSQYDFWLRTYYGVDPLDGSALYVANNTATAANRRIIMNKNGLPDTLTTLASNGKFEYQGSVIPDLYGSFSQSITYKNLTLSALFTFQIGGKTYDGVYAGLMSVGSYGGALHKDILNRWQKRGDVTNVPRMDNGRLVDFNAASSRWLVDASYFNIRTINLAYKLPRTLTSKLSMNNGQFFIALENPAFFSKRKGMNNQQAFTGVTSNAYPPSRVLTAGVTLNF